MIVEDWSDGFHLNPSKEGASKGEEGLRLGKDVNGVSITPSPSGDNAGWPHRIEWPECLGDLPILSSGGLLK